MQTQFVSSPDGTRVAYDVQGAGPALLFLHGGGQTRQRWHQLGYVERLSPTFTVITLDIRGNGESDMPVDPAAYTIDRHIHDVLTVVDACSVDQFTLWGFSYGGNIGRYVAVASDRVAKLAMIGIPFGAAASGAFRAHIEQLQERWVPIIAADTQGTLNPAALSTDDYAEYQRRNIPVTLAWLSAMLAWRPIEPSDLPCPTLWLVGSENESAMASIGHYQGVLPASQVEVEVVAGLDHGQELTEIDTVLPRIRAFIEV